MTTIEENNDFGFEVIPISYHFGFFQEKKTLRYNRDLSITIEVY